MLLTINQFVGSFSVPDSRYTNLPFFWIQILTDVAFLRKLVNRLPLCFRHPNRIFLSNGKHPGSLPFSLSTVKQTKLFHSISEMSLVRSSDWLELIYDIAFGVYIISCGRFPFRKKNPEISVGAKVEFPIGKKLFHFVLNPGTSRCPTVDLELVQTTRNVNGTRHSVWKFQPGKRAHLFRFSTFSGNFPVGRADETCSIYRRTRNSGNFD